MKRERGLSIFGIIFMIAILSGIVSLAIKIVPPYLDFLALCDATHQVLAQPRASLSRLEQVHGRIENQVSINNIDLKELGKDALVVTSNGGVLHADIDYVVIAPVYKDEELDLNIDMHFTKSIDANAAE